MNLQAAADALGLAPSTLRHQIRNKKLRAYKMGDNWFVTEEEVHRYRTESLGASGSSTSSHSPEERHFRKWARSRVAVALASGALIREGCAVCGAAKAQAHHPNGYDKPLEIEWLCLTHHRLAHKKGKSA